MRASGHVSSRGLTMAEDRKPKIDLKSRLQKMGGPGAAPPPPPGTGSIPAPSMARPALTPVPPPGSVPPGIPKPTMSGRPQAIDPSHRLAAVAQPFRPATPPHSAPAVVHAQRIEVDEGAVHQARSGGFKRGLMAGIVIAGMFLVVGYVGGNASTQGSARAQGVRDAHDLSADLLKARDSLDQLKQKLQEGGKSIVGDRKFPGGLAQQLSGLNVDFGGDKLFG